MPEEINDLCGSILEGSPTETLLTHLSEDPSVLFGARDGDGNSCLHAAVLARREDVVGVILNVVTRNCSSSEERAGEIMRPKVLLRKKKMHFTRPLCPGFTVSGDSIFPISANG